MTEETTLFAALAKAQGEMTNVGKDSTNPHFRKTYASLAAVRDHVIPALSRHGIAVVQIPGNVDGERVSVRTVLLRGSEQFDAGTISTPVESRGRTAAQAIGSAITYLRRYALAAVAGVAPEDDDGAAAIAPQPRRRSAADDLRAALRAAFGPSDGPGAAARADELARQVCGCGLAAVFEEEGRIRAMLDALEGGMS